MATQDEILANLALAGKAAREGTPLAVTGEKRDLVKVRYSHEAMIDLIISNPWIKQGDLARHFGYSESWISIVMNTDMFKAKLAERRGELVDPEIRATMEERFRAVVTKSLQVLQEKLSKPENDVPDNLVLRAAELGAKALGLGGNAPPPAPVIAVDHLSTLAERLIALQGKTRRESYEIIEDVSAKSPVAAGSEGTSSSTNALLPR